MPTACCLIRREPKFRYDAFDVGLRQLGYDVIDVPMRASRIMPGDVLVLWNRYASFDNLAKQFEARGNAVIVAENGYLPMLGVKDVFALALTHHNGAGCSPQIEGRRHLLKVELQPWRDIPGDILLLPQRGFGAPGVAMPKAWPNDIMRRLRRCGNVRVRQHPGPARLAALLPTIERDLKGVRCAVTWGSGAGLKTLVAGVPTFHDFPRWIGSCGASNRIDSIADGARAMGDREKMLDVVSAAQWSAEEMATGKPFSLLLEMHEAQRKCA
jgi:hypothetical protein